MNAQISFLDGTFVLIHIPLSLYSTFLQPILQILLPESQGPVESEPTGLTVDNQHDFLNISVTPVECSVVCHSSLAQRIFEPAISQLPANADKTVTISKDQYSVFSVISAGMDAGSRVVDLTLPLALAGVPIFFVTTYYCDFILVPTRDRGSVVKALVSRGFELSEDESLLKSPGHTRGRPSDGSGPPSTPPPSNVAELQERTFELLKQRSVAPHAKPGLRLVQCSGREKSGIGGEYPNRPSLSRSQTGHGRMQSWVDTVDAKLYISLVSALVSQPRFLSVTLAQGDPPSLLLDHSLLPIFGDSLVGDTNGNLVPIFLDLVNVSFEATGIVSGVAGKLVEEMQAAPESVELSYLSTARAGAVILSAERSAQALDILGPLLAKE